MKIVFTLNIEEVEQSIREWLMKNYPQKGCNDVTVSVDIVEGKTVATCEFTDAF